MMDRMKQRDVQGAGGAARHGAEEAEGLDAILDQAAAIAVEQGDDPDQFMTAARDAYLRANPALREHIERTNMLAQMEALRRMGVLAQA
jgi:hypothetical protein